MSTLRTRLEVEEDQAPKWGNLRTIRAETIDLVLTLGSGAVSGPMAGLLTVRQTAGRLGVHENTIRNWVEKGVLQAVRLPGSGFRRFRPADVERIRFGIMGAIATGTTGAAHELPVDYEPTFRNSDDL